MGPPIDALRVISWEAAVKLLVTFLIFVTAALAQSWNSRLLSNVNGIYTPQTVSFASRNWTLDDFSYAGYFLGTKSLGSPAT